MGILRISNELLLTNRALVKQCFQWLEENHDAVIEQHQTERHCMVYRVIGNEIPEGNFDLTVEQIAPGVMTIKINRL